MRHRTPLAVLCILQVVDNVGTSKTGFIYCDMGMFKSTRSNCSSPFLHEGCVPFVKMQFFIK